MRANCGGEEGDADVLSVTVQSVPGLIGAPVPTPAATAVLREEQEPKLVESPVAENVRTHLSRREPVTASVATEGHQGMVTVPVAKDLKGSAASQMWTSVLGDRACTFVSTHLAATLVGAMRVTQGWATTVI